jgi:SAM-dependent methyltransferase
MAGNPAASARFDRWASTYEASPLQPALFAPVHQTALQLAQHLVPDARRVLDVGCGTGRLLRQARRRYRPAELVGVDLARGMLTAAMVATTTELGIHYLTASLLLRRRCPSLPGELDAALTAHRLALIGYDHTPWFSLPDAQVIATQRRSTARPPRGSGAASPNGAASRD